MSWTPIPIGTKLFLNVDEEVLTKGLAAVENAFINEAGGHSRFPGLTQWLDLGGKAKVYLTEWRGDLMAVTAAGKAFRIDKSATARDVTEVPVTINTGYRPVFTKTDDEMLMAGGGSIIRYAGEKTEVLSKDAPLASHVGFIDNYVIAVEVDSGRFHHCEAGSYRQWSPLDVFSASGRPDNLNGMIITDYRELLLTGRDSIEQFERLLSGSTPFFRRWAVGEGVLAPYTLSIADNATWGLNKDKEFIRFSGQISQPASDDIGKALDGITDWTDAWTAKIHILGQKFLLLQAPKAASPYDEVGQNSGMTYVYDYRQQKWFTLYGWNDAAGVPGGWPGCSHVEIDGQHYVGGEGVIYRLDPESFTTGGSIQRMYGRTAHLSVSAATKGVTIKNVRIKAKRGVGDPATSPAFNLRVIRDGGRPSRWVARGLGRAGERSAFLDFGGFGNAQTFQFEWFVTDTCDVELVSLEADI